MNSALNNQTNNNSHSNNSKNPNLKGVPASFPKNPEEVFMAANMAFEVCDHLPKEAFLIRSQLLQTKEGLVLLILPVGKILELDFLSQNLNTPCSGVFDFENNPSGWTGYFSPALPSLYALSQTFVDNSIRNLEAGEFLYLLNDQKNNFIKLNQKAFVAYCIQENVIFMDLYSSTDKDSKLFTDYAFLKQRTKIRLEEITELPTIPSMVDELLKLRVNPEANAEDLAHLVEKDPSLAAQVIAWANSPFYGYAMNIASVEEAIMKTLGYDLVMNLALGVALGSSMKLPKEGPLGLERYWRNSIYVASLSQMLLEVYARKSKKNGSPNPGLKKGSAYLAGLLHNFGYLILGQLFLPQYRLLLDQLVLNPFVNLIELENKILGINHSELAAWLLKKWNLPETIVQAVAEHHALDLKLESQVLNHYAHVVQISNYLLAQDGLGEFANRFWYYEPLDQEYEDQYQRFRAQKESLEIWLKDLKNV
ncbi:MAG: HDOD domain-containing protein [Gammaproteobacteria bacterium]